MPVGTCQAVVRAPWYDISGRKYLDLEWDTYVHRVKVPFRYNRVMCNVGGLTPIQTMPEGTVVDCVIDSTGGYYVLMSIRISSDVQSDPVADPN
jgi:hypothetical protein